MYEFSLLGTQDEPWLPFGGKCAVHAPPSIGEDVVAFYGLSYVVQSGRLAPWVVAARSSLHAALPGELSTHVTGGCYLRGMMHGESMEDKKGLDLWTSGDFVAIPSPAVGYCILVTDH